jgi:hypothetical protein
VVCCDVNTEMPPTDRTAAESIAAIIPVTIAGRIRRETNFNVARPAIGGSWVVSRSGQPWRRPLSFPLCWEADFPRLK